MSSKLIVPRKRGVSEDKLNEKQRLFVDYYLTTTAMNAAEAARLAGYTAPNAGSKLLKITAINLAIGKAQKDRADRVKIEADRVILELASIGLSNIQDVMDEDGNYLLPHELPRHVAAAIYSVEWRNVRDALTGEIIGREVSNYHFWDKFSSLALLGRHLGVADGKVNTGEATKETLLAMLLASKSNKNNVIDSNSIQKLALGD